MRIRRTIARWTALIVLMNIGLGFCDCLRDAVPQPPGSSSLPVLTRKAIPAEAPSCGDDCESCICCAALVMTKPSPFAVDRTASRLSVFSVLSLFNADYIPLKRPPRA